MKNDPLSAAIEAAVERALERKLPDLIRANIPPPAPAPVAAPAVLDGEKFVPLKEASARLKCHRTTLLRMERQGRIPMRRRMSGKTGWLQSELDEYLVGLATISRPVRADAH